MAKSKSKSITTPFLTGLFILVGTTIAVVIIIWLGANQFLKENKYYTTYFETSVEGLEKGSAVKYLGVPVGTISKIGVAPDGRLIEIIMQIDKKLDIKSNMRVKAEMSGIAGGKFLQLHFPDKIDPNFQELKIDFSPPFQLIRSIPSGIDEFSNSALAVINKLRDLQVKEISENTVRLLKTSSDFFDNKELYDIISEINLASQTLNHILLAADSSRIIRNLSVTTDTLFQTASKLKLFAEKLNNEIEQMRLKERTNDAFTQVDTMLSNGNKIINVLGFRAETFLFGMNDVLEDLKITNKQLKKTLRMLNDNPSQMILSEPPPPEK
jgi:phospholipid/cholesterol/gamma-HCH transport system substrate-binding protein